MRGRKGMVRGALVLLWTFGGALAWGQDGGSVKPAASVNGEVIPMAELETMLKQEGPMPVAMPEAVRKQQRQVALNALIDKVLLKQFLKKNAPPIDPKELDNRLFDLVAGLQKENKTLKDFCRERNQTPEQVKEDIATFLLWRAYAEAHVNDQMVEKFYLENKDMFDQVQVHAAEIMVHVPSKASPAEWEQAKVRLAQLREKIVNKEMDFALAAKQFSQGWTRDQGGDLDWFPHLKGILPEPIMQAVFSPQMQPGQITDAIVTENGVHILKLIDKKPGQPSDFTKLKDTVRLLCIEDLQQSTLQELRKAPATKVEIYLAQ